MPYWMIAAAAVKLGLDLYGQSQQKKAEKELAEVQAAAAKLQGAETVRRLEMERGNTLSTLTARAGRAGAEVATTTAVPGASMVDIGRAQVDNFGRQRRGEALVPVDVSARSTVAGAGGSVLIQQQRIADLYEQEILYSKRQTALAEQGADIQADYANASGNLDTIGTILEAGTDLYTMKYRYDQYNIPGANPYEEQWRTQNWSKR